MDVAVAHLFTSNIFTYNSALVFHNQFRSDVNCRYNQGGRTVAPDDGRKELFVRYDRTVYLCIVVCDVMRNALCTPQSYDDIVCVCA